MGRRTARPYRLFHENAWLLALVDPTSRRDLPCVCTKVLYLPYLLPMNNGPLDNRHLSTTTQPGFQLVDRYHLALPLATHYYTHPELVARDCHGLPRIFNTVMSRIPE